MALGVAIRATFAKSEMATDIISQLCFDPATIAWWIGAVRARLATRQAA